MRIVCEISVLTKWLAAAPPVRFGQPRTPENPPKEHFEGKYPWPLRSDKTHDIFSYPPDFPGGDNLPKGIREHSILQSYAPMWWSHKETRHLWKRSLCATGGIALLKRGRVSLPDTCEKKSKVASFFDYIGLSCLKIYFGGFFSFIVKRATKHKSFVTSKLLLFIMDKSASFIRKNSEKNQRNSRKPSLKTQPHDQEQEKSWKKRV